MLERRLDGICMHEDMKEQLISIINHYGKDNQIRKAIEELDELKEALNENHTKDHIIEEMADVLVMLTQLALIYDIDPEVVDDMMEYKIDRTIERMGKDE